MNIFEELSAPFPPEAIHWRAQQVYERDGKFTALALAYLDARDVMDRLDAVVGGGSWTDYYDEGASGRVICKLSLLLNDQWITKSDGAGNTDIEGDKGGISDAFKRAGVKWGIGRYLYQLGNTYAPCEVATRDGSPVKSGNGKYIFKKWAPQAQHIFRDALAGIAPEPNRIANREKLQGPFPSITALEKAIRSFAGDARKCATWEDWDGLRNEVKYRGLMEQAERDHPDWWNGWRGMPDGFVPLKSLIEQVETDLADAKARVATA